MTQFLILLTPVAGTAGFCHTAHAGEQVEDMIPDIRNDMNEAFPPPLTREQIHAHLEQGRIETADTLSRHKLPPTITESDVRAWLQSQLEEVRKTIPNAFALRLTARHYKDGRLEAQFDIHTNGVNAPCVFDRQTIAGAVAELKGPVNGDIYAKKGKI